MWLVLHDRDRYNSAQAEYWRFFGKSISPLADAWSSGRLRLNWILGMNSSYIPLLCVDVIINIWPGHTIGLANMLVKEDPGVIYIVRPRSLQHSINTV